MSKCYDCAKEITGEKLSAEVYSEDGTLMSLDFHPECYVRAVKGGVPTNAN